MADFPGLQSITRSELITITFSSPLDARDIYQAIVRGTLKPTSQRPVPSIVHDRAEIRLEFSCKPIPSCFMIAATNIIIGKPATVVYMFREELDFDAAEVEKEKSWLCAMSSDDSAWAVALDEILHRKAETGVSIKNTPQKMVDGKMSEEHLAAWKALEMHDDRWRELFGYIMGSRVDEGVELPL